MARDFSNQNNIACGEIRWVEVGACANLAWPRRLFPIPSFKPI